MHVLSGICHLPATFAFFAVLDVKFLLRMTKVVGVTSNMCSPAWGQYFNNESTSPVFVVRVRSCVK